MKKKMFFIGYVAILTLIIFYFVFNQKAATPTADQKSNENFSSSENTTNEESSELDSNVESLEDLKKLDREEQQIYCAEVTASFRDRGPLDEMNAIDGYCVELVSVQN